MALSVLTPHEAGAAGRCDGRNSAAVRVVFGGAGWEPDLERGVVEHLRAGLAPAGFVVCAEPSPPATTVATIELRRNPGERVTATIEVRDGVTRKRVARDIDLSDLPADGRALGIGVAADELLRASWVELTLADAPEPDHPPPPAVHRTVERSLRRPPPATELGFRGSLEGFAGGLTLAGGDVVLRHWVVPWLALGAGIGLREGLEETSLHGGIRANGFGANASAVGRLLTVGPARLGFELAVSATQLRLRGVSDQDVVRGDGAELAVTVEGGASAWLDVTRSLALVLRGGAGFAARGVSAVDFGRTGAGARGVEWYVALGPSVQF